MQLVARQGNFDIIKKIQAALYLNFGFGVIAPRLSAQLQNVISLRINDDEKKTLEKLTKTTSKSVTEIMREAIDLWRARQRKLCMD